MHLYEKVVHKHTSRVEVGKESSHSKIHFLSSRRKKNVYFLSVKLNSKQQQQYQKALDDIEQNRIRVPSDYPTDLTFLRENQRYLELLRHVSKFDGYG